MQTDLNDLVQKFLEQHRITRLAVMLEGNYTDAEFGPVGGATLAYLVINSQGKETDDLYTNTRAGVTIDAEPGDFQTL